MSTLTFEYRAVDRAGVERRGVEHAASEAEAYRRLSADGLVPLSIRSFRARGARSGRGVKLKHLAHFTAQLATLVGARISISDGLISIAEQEADPGLRDLIKGIAARVDSGVPLAEALGEHVELFGEPYVATIRAAEQSGNLVKVLEHQSEMLERLAETRGMVKQALMYPLCVMGVLAVGVTFLVGYVVPKFAAMFESRGVALPPLTQGLAWAGYSVQTFWYLYAAALVAAVWLAPKALRTPRGHAFAERLLSRTPGIGQVLACMGISRFCRVMGISLSSGLGLIESLELAGRSAGRGALMRDVERMVRQVRTGGRLTDVLPGCAYLTPFSKRMLAAGETSAQMPAMCALIARHYDREAQQLSKGLSSLIEPLLIVMIALVVLVIALGIFLPMWDMVKLVG